MKIGPRAAVWLVAACAGALSRPAAASPRVQIAVAVRSDGSATPSWIAAIRDRHPRAQLARLSAQRRALSAAERAWLERFRSIVPDWARGMGRLRAPFSGVSGPERVVVLVGNQGGDDGFTAGDRTIAVDLSKWVEAYGPAGDADTEGRIRRILSHEYTHLLTRRWRARHPVALDTPLRRALWDCFNEGLGNYRSLSPRWLTAEGALTAHALEAEARLALVFVERMTGLARGPDRDEEERLLAGLSRGPFDRKWGAVLVALWLADEARGDDRRLRPWVARGPEGVLALAEAHLPAALAARLRAAVRSGKVE